MKLIHDFLVFIGLRKLEPASPSPAEAEVAIARRRAALLRADQRRLPGYVRSSMGERGRVPAARRADASPSHLETSPSVHMRWQDEGRSGFQEPVEAPAFRSGGGGDFAGGGASASWEHDELTSHGSSSFSSDSGGSTSSDSGSSSSD